MMILKRVDSTETFIVLKEHMWAALVWPVIESHDYASRKVFSSLNPDGEASWFTLFEPESYEVIQGVPVLSHGWIRIESTSTPVPIIPYVIEAKSWTLSQAALVLLADYLKCIENPHKITRKTLLTALGNHLHMNVDVLLESDRTGKSHDKANESSIDATLVQQLIGNLDDDERNDYSQLHDKAKAKEHDRKRKQWKMWMKEKMDEVKAIGRVSKS